MIVSAIDKLDVDRKMPVLEIGSGYEDILRNLESIGFKNLFGVENSKHRAEVVNKTFGYKIFHGEFGDESVQKNLLEFRPFRIIISHHAN